MYNLADALTDHHEVNVIAVSRTSDYEQPDNEFSMYRVFEEHPLWFYLRGIKSLFSGDPIQCGTYLSGNMKTWVDDHISSYDLVYCTHLATVKYVEGYEIPKVIDLVDAVSNSFNEFAGDSSVLWRAIYRIEAERAKDYEVKVGREFDRCFITTENDQEMIPSDDITVIPNGVSTTLLDYEQVTALNEDIVFLGDLSYLPNEVAVKWFVNDIFPLVQEECPDATFTIVGKDPSKRVQRFEKRDGVDVTGFVDDPYEYVYESRVSVAPIQIGGGIQNKVLESLGLGTPVVTTRFGASGIDITEGEHLLVRDDAEDFADAVIDIFEDPPLAERLATNGRELIREKYTWESIGELLNNEINDVLETSTKAPTQ